MHCKSQLDSTGMGSPYEMCDSQIAVRIHCGGPAEFLRQATAVVEPGIGARSASQARIGFKRMVLDCLFMKAGSPRA